MIVAVVIAIPLRRKGMCIRWRDLIESGVSTVRSSAWMHSRGLRYMEPEKTRWFGISVQHEDTESRIPGDFI
jgi:hypothetical protein